MVFVGIDIAKTNHVACAVDETGEKLTRPLPFKNAEEGFEKLAAWLEGVAEDPCDAFIAMEATGHYWMACFSFLAAREYKACVVNPMQVKAMRKLKGRSRVKNDPIDSWLIAETLRLGEAVETKMATDEVQSLKTLTRYRQALKQELATIKTQCICVLDSYFPEYAGHFSDPFGAASLAVLKKCPMPEDLGRVRASTLAKEMSEASRGRISGEKAAELKAAAKKSIGVKLGADAASFQIKSMIGQMEFLDETISKVEGRVADLLMAIEPLIVTVPGVSTATGRPARRRDRRRAPVQERLRDRQVRRARLRRVPIGAVRGERRAHHKARLALSETFDMACGEPVQALRPDDEGLLRQAESPGQMPSRRGDGLRPQTLPYHLRHHARPSRLRGQQVDRFSTPCQLQGSLRRLYIIASKSIQCSAIKVRFPIKPSSSKTYGLSLDFI